MDGGLQAPSIIFTQPALTAGTLPAVADVSGTSPVAVQVTSRVQLSSLIITYDTGLPLVSFPSPSGTSFSSGITWANTPGVGSHVLTATLTCNDGETAKATETVVVAQPACTTDANCATGDRCCTTSGLCYPIVAPGADCDCEHPCPTDQGCFPGVCGAAPQKCRPGCFPGSWGPAPNYGEPAATCANDPITNQPAYCAQLPASQSTAANQGGACAVGDACDPITQTGCAGIPLNRALPVSATNPVVPYNCVPVAPSVNGCIPAGPLGSGATNCNGDTEPGITGTACGATAGNCAAGLDCTQVVDSNGDALTPPTCVPQCATPAETCNSNGCPTGSFCNLTFTDGKVDFTTGTCLSDEFCDEGSNATDAGTLDGGPSAMGTDGGTACGTGLTNCSGTCVDLQNDENNCGCCGNSCSNFMITGCSGGGCVDNLVCVAETCCNGNRTFCTGC